MKGIVKLKVPSTLVTPKLFVITLSKDGVQKKFTKIDFTLEGAITKCWWNNNTYTIQNYIGHVELSVDEINSLFKNFTP